MDRNLRDGQTRRSPSAASLARSSPGSRQKAQLVAARFEKYRTRVTEQYKEHLSKPFFPSLKQYIMEARVSSWSGKEGMWSRSSQVIGATNPRKRHPARSGEISHSISAGNVIHASDSPESAAREIGIHFKNTKCSTISGSMSPFIRNTELSFL